MATKQPTAVLRRRDLSQSLEEYARAHGLTDAQARLGWRIGGLLRLHGGMKVEEAAKLAAPDGFRCAPGLTVVTPEPKEWNAERGFS